MCQMLASHLPYLAPTRLLTPRALRTKRQKNKLQEDVRALDKMTFSEWFEGKGGSRGSIERLWDPIAYALGFIDCDNISARCMLTIFQVRGATHTR